ncbi:MAG: phosphoribosylamine--glycine ligase, partial [Gammaproteobacteria bacterium]|nr:phosphoribosylamine--glycine ligase [Gammaproteobacteria bacterium]
GLPETPETDRKVFHAGTALKGKDVITNGGRVLCVTALGATVSAAQRRAYEIVSQIRWSKAHYRHDIGYRAIARERAR